MRLIDADKIKLPQGFFEKVDNVPKFYEWLDKQPTVDAVEVVRCEDCRFFDKHYVGFGYNVCHKLNQMMHENDYCSCGERRETDGKAD